MDDLPLEQLSPNSRRKILARRCRAQISNSQYNRQRDNQENVILDDKGRAVARRQRAIYTVQKPDKDKVYKQNKQTIREIMKTISKDPVAREQYLARSGLPIESALAILNAANDDGTCDIAPDERFEELESDETTETPRLEYID